MSLKFVVQEVTVEHVKKPGNPKGYYQANVVHTYNGQARTKKIISFANPGVFDAVKDLKAGQTIEVEITKDGEYSNWSKVSVIETESSSGVPAQSTGSTPTGGRVTGSNYETREERAARQVLIVRQSCLAQAVTLSGGTVENTQEILDLAQKFVDWVFEKPDLFDQPNDLDGDAS